jgi:hypothetical protein
MQITEDLVLGAKFTLDRAGGILVRIFEVTGLTSGRDTLAQAVLGQDSNTGAGIPRYGDPHPDVAGLYVETIVAEPVKNSRTAAQVTVTYASPEISSAPGAVSIAITGSQRTKLLTRSPADSSTLQVKYTDPSGNVLTQIMQVPVLSPNTILTFVRQEVKSPLALSQQFRRTLNASPWQSGATKTWLCRAIDSRSLGNLTRYEVKYVFEYDPDGWDHIEYYKDPFTGKVPGDVTQSNDNSAGVAKLQVYGTMEFSRLGLPNAF